MCVLLIELGINLRRSRGGNFFFFFFFWHSLRFDLRLHGFYELTDICDVYTMQEGVVIDGDAVAFFYAHQIRRNDHPRWTCSSAQVWRRFLHHTLLLIA